MDEADRATDQISAARASTAGRLSAGDNFPQSTWIRWSSSHYNDADLRTHTRVYHTIPTSGEGTSGDNYDETRSGYDEMQRTNRTVSPGGTITRTVFDVRSQATEVWIGTDDASATDADPSGGGATGNNMVRVTSKQYDGGTDGGDGILSKVTEHVDGSTPQGDPATDRVTTYAHDFRDRLTETTGELNSFDKSTFDNLDRVIVTERKVTNDAGDLIAKTETKYDNRGGTYQTVVWAVDPTTGTPGNTLTNNNWFDASGNLIKRQPIGSDGFVKNSFDGAGRRTAVYHGYWSGDGTDEPDSISQDFIFEQLDYSIDASNFVTLATRRARFHDAPLDATGKGALQGPSGAQPKSRDEYEGRWSNGTGGLIARAGYGTNANAGAPARPSSPPDRSDTVLLGTLRFDNCGDLVERTDPAGTISQAEFDDAGRQVKAVSNYVVNGSGADENVTVDTTYNPDGTAIRIVAINSSTGNQVTRHEYGVTPEDGSDIASNTLSRANFYPNSADGQDRISFTYNRQGQPTTTTDQNGTIHAYDYDKLGRITQDRVTTLASGVASDVQRISTTYEVRGLVKQVTSHSTTSDPSDEVNQVEFAYNDFQQLATEYQAISGTVSTGSTPKVQYAYEPGFKSGVSANNARPTSITYPHGSRSLDFGYGSANSSDDKLSRVKTLTYNSTQVTQYIYAGILSIVQVDYSEPQVRYDLITGTGSNPYAGLDRFGRIIDLLWEKYSATPADLERVEYGYDRASNRTYRENTVASSANDDLYQYDGLNRLVRAYRGDLAAAKNRITAAQSAQLYGLDPMGNWLRVIDYDSSAATNKLTYQGRTHNAANEITNIDSYLGETWIEPVYDRNGSMTTIPQPDDPAQSYTVTYDAWNRLALVKDGMTTVAQNACDGLNRRMTKTVSGTTRHYYYSAGWQELESGTGGATNFDRQLVWGLRYVDDLILRDRDNGGSLNERKYVLQDANWNVTAIVDPSANVDERYRYAPYGSVTFMDASFSSRATSNFAWTRLFTGQHRDDETKLHQYRRRIYDATLGQFLQGESVATGSRYEYVNGNPIRFVDPSGLYAVPGIPRSGAEMNVILHKALPEATDVDCGWYTNKNTLNCKPKRGTEVIVYWPTDEWSSREKLSSILEKVNKFYNQYCIAIDWMVCDFATRDVGELRADLHGGQHYTHDITYYTKYFGSLEFHTEKAWDNEELAWFKKTFREVPSVFLVDELDIEGIKLGTDIVGVQLGTFVWMADWSTGEVKYDFTLAHELGHLYLNDLEHDKRFGNLMNEEPFALRNADLDKTQQRTIRGNKWMQKI